MVDGKDVNGDRLAESASNFLAGGKVGSWADRSGNANTRTQGTTANQPTYSTGGGLDFDGNDFMTGALPNSLTGNPDSLPLSWRMPLPTTSKCLDPQLKCHQLHPFT